MDIYKNWMNATTNHVKQNKPDSYDVYIRNLKLHEYIYICTQMFVPKSQKEAEELLLKEHTYRKLSPHHI